MATTVGASAPSSPSAPTVVGFGRPSWRLPVRPGEALRWAVIAMFVANLGRIPVMSTGGRDAEVVLNDLCVAVICVFSIVAGLLRRSLLLDSVLVLALLFAAIGFGSAVLAVPRFGVTAFELTVSLSYLARWLAYLGIYLFIVNNVRYEQIARIWTTLESTVLSLTAFGVFQSIFLPNFAQVVYPESRAVIDWDPQGHRLVSTVLEPNIVAIMIVLVLLIELAQISAGERVKPWKPGLLLVGLALTLSRSGILALMVGLLVIILIRGISLRVVRLFALVGFLSMAVLPKLIGFAAAYGKFDVGANTSAGARLISWLTAIETIAAHPVIGVGFNTYGYVKQRAGMELLGSATFNSDGGLLFAAVMTGFVGLTVYVLMYRAVFRRCRRIWRMEDRPAAYQGIAVGVAAGLFAVVVHSIFVNSIFTTFVMEIMWITWGLTFVIARGPDVNEAPA